MQNQHSPRRATLATLAAAVLGGLTVGCVIGTGSLSDLGCGDTFSHSDFALNENGEWVCVCDDGYVWEQPGNLDNYECERATPRVPTGDDCRGRHNVLQGDTCYCEAGYEWCTNDPDDFSCCQAAKGADNGTGGALQCGDPLTNSTLQDGVCFCDPGFDWCTDDPDDINCCVVGGKDTAACDEPHNELVDGECHCEVGYTWCSNDPADYSCCETEGNGGTGGVDPGVEPDPADCTADTEGASFCSHTEAMGPEGSRLWMCMGGQWQLDTTTAEQTCEFDGYDFAYGCVATDEAVQYMCGNGPGTACDSSEPATCESAQVLSECLYGKLTTVDCLAACQEIGDEMGTTYDYGDCAEQDGAPAECACCFSEDEGCGPA